MDSLFSQRVRAGTRFATVLVLVLSLGLHWALLQSVAWVGMMVSYSRGAALSEAVSKTFDGKHPCPLCKMIKKGRASEKQQAEKKDFKPNSKTEVGLVWDNVSFILPTHSGQIPSLDLSAPRRSTQPPKPPPRTA